ncbi:MAG TPA: hypothetical protein VL282_18775 [Tepidisphaeraceae bacterium]|nr:hypothetical protein [Tepidisphaeraceae bacterium]
MTEPDERGYREGESDSIPAPTPVVEYATPPRLNADARRSLIYGSLLMVPFVTGFLAMRFGQKGARIAEQTGIGRRTSLIGFILGVANLIIWIVIAVSLPFAVVRARQQAQMVQCASQLRSLTIGIYAYANGNSGWTPPSLNIALIGIPVYACPAAGGFSNYVYVAKSIRMNTVRGSDYVTIYEPPTNHARGSNFAFLDGHVEMVPPARAQKIIAELNAGFNPPRAANIK